MQSELTDIWDIHTHILPGIDDGAKNWDMTLEMLKKSWDAGVRHIIATPHYLPWQHNASAKTIMALCNEAMIRSQKELGIHMEILPGQEIYYHVDALKDLSEGKALSLAGGRNVLVEFAEDSPVSDILMAADSFRRSPFCMVTAHFERYQALWKRENLDRFLETGAILQSNIGEMRRSLFDSGRRRLQKIYAAQEISHVASDMHNLTSRPPISEESLQWFRKHLPQNYCLDITGLRLLNVKPDLEWAMLVAYNRGKMDEVRGTSLYEHYAAMSNGYDVVVGSIANDRMFYVLDNFFLGNITDKALVMSLSALQLGKQYVAITEKACKRVKIEAEVELSLLERVFLRDLSESNRVKGVNIANEICRDYRREGQFFDEILKEAER